MPVSIRGFVKTFGKKVAVDNLSLSIPAGSFYGLVGPNGAGKTTTIKMLTGLLMPDAGSASIFGNDVWSDVNSAKRAIGLMPQADEIFKTITGLQLLTYAGMLRDMSRAESVKRANDLLSAFDLTEAANTMVSDYSTGMTKKICLATAMIPLWNWLKKCARTWRLLTKVMLQLLALLQKWLRAKILKIALWSLLVDVTQLRESTGLTAASLITLLSLLPSLLISMPNKDGRNVYDFYHGSPSLGAYFFRYAKVDLAKNRLWYSHCFWTCDYMRSWFCGLASRKVS